MEELNEGYIPNRLDVVKPLSFISSQRFKWDYGVVTKVFLSLTPECWITTNTGKQIIEYCYYLEPVQNAKDE